MSDILNSLNAHNFIIFQPILMKQVSKFIVHRALSDKRYLLLGLRSPFKYNSVTAYELPVTSCRGGVDNGSTTCTT